MCKKLQEIHDLQATDILTKYYPQFEKSEFVSSRIILDALEINHKATCFEELESSLFLKGNDIILGIACSEGNDVNILYSDKLDSKEANFVLAHELAHCCLHLPVSSEFHVELKTKNDIYSSFLSRPLRNRQNTRKEQEADEFATNLLLPTTMFAEYLVNSESFSVREISDHFCVPEWLVHKKILMFSKRNKI